MPDPIRKHVSMREACELSGLSKDTIRSYVDDGILPGFRLPRGHRRIWADTLESFITKRDEPWSAIPRPRKPQQVEMTTQPRKLYDPSTYRRFAERAKAIRSKDQA